MKLQSVARLIYPPQCLGCGDLVAGERALCPTCWSSAPFIGGSTCVKCGAPLLGVAPGDDAALCDDCTVRERPWDAGAAVFTYDGIARRLVLALKHGDRQDLVPALAGWMCGRLRCGIGSGDVVAPVPVHWRRLARRRFNQSALLARAVARTMGARFLPDALCRRRATPMQEGLTAAERFTLQTGAIAAHPRRGTGLAGRRVLIVDDVMTSGATLTAAAMAARAAGATRVDTVVLARVVRDL